MTNQWQESDLERFVLGDLTGLATVLSASNLELLGTQVKCKFGRIDMLCYEALTVYVVEFKAVRASESTVGQVIRYASAVRQVNPYPYLPDEDWAYRDNPVHVTTVIVAPSFDKNVLASVDHPIVATRNPDGEFVLEWADISVVEQVDLTLEDAMQPYLKNLEQAGRQQEQQRQRLADRHGRS